MTWQNLPDLPLQRLQLPQALQVPLQVPSGAEHIDRALLLNGIPGQQQAVFPVQQGDASRCMARNVQHLEPIAAAFQGIPLPERLPTDLRRKHIGVLRMDQTGTECPQAAGVVMVAMGEHHPHRQAGDLPHCLRHMALLHTGIDEQGFLLPDNQKLTHPIVQNIKLLHKLPDLRHLQTPPHNRSFSLL